MNAVIAVLPAEMKLGCTCRERKEGEGKMSDKRLHGHEGERRRRTERESESSPCSGAQWDVIWTRAENRREANNRGEFHSIVLLQA